MKRTTRNFLLSLLPLATIFLLARDSSDAVFSGYIVDSLFDYGLLNWEKSLFEHDVTPYIRQFVALTVPLSLPLLFAILYDLITNRSDFDRLVIKARSNKNFPMLYDNFRWKVVAEYVLFGLFLYTARYFLLYFVATDKIKDENVKNIVNIIGPFGILYITFIILCILILAMTRIFVTYPANKI